jgi:hypothetical protein
MEIVVDAIFTYYERSHVVPPEEIRQFCEDVICFHAPLQHHSEVAWALWLSKILNIPLTKDAVEAVGHINSSVCALLALDLSEKGLVDIPLSTNNWQQHATESGLYSEMWLIAYEAVKRGWMKSKVAYLGKDAGFQHLHRENVFFYDSSISGKNVFQERKERMKDRIRRKPELKKEFGFILDDGNNEIEIDDALFDGFDSY